MLRLGALIGSVIAIGTAQQTAIELDDAGGDAVQKRPVVGDHHCGTARSLQHTLQLCDAINVQMVGGLIQQQQVGLQRERQRQCGTLAFATGGAVRCGVAGQSEALQELAQALLGLPWLDAGQGRVCRQGVCRAQQQALAQSGGGGQLRFLVDADHAQTIAAFEIALIQSDPTTQHPQQ